MQQDQKFTNKLQWKEHKVSFSDKVFKLVRVSVRETKVKTLEIVASILYAQSKKKNQKTSAIQKDNLAELGLIMRNIFSRLDNLEFGTKKDKPKQVESALLF
ncbi:9964_t:CDS:2 [Gigaspora margarita]|uniref:9964_t:CDS:1 n=1 Tax=Gigaspora margarita TaxID=4874 RepID=A0ABN7UFI8_GIGMA|nr:9964_t:CDS:2 [Gigaspora margarita]